jgi:translation initiation factor 1A
MKYKYEKDNIRLPLPENQKNEMFAIVNRVLGGSRMDVKCSDGKSRLARVPGRKRRGMGRIIMGDLLIISPWDIQNEKADILYRYRKNQAKFLSRRKILPRVIDVF